MGGNINEGSESEVVLPVEKPSTEVAFFLGAGASVGADVPDTFGFVETFIKSLDSTQSSSLLKFIKILEDWCSKQIPPKKRVDIELLLEALQRLADKEQDLLLPFFDGIKLRILDFDAELLLRKLQDFIKSRVIVGPEAIKYLDPLRGFIQEFRPLDIYSANYDTCIELFCSENKLDYKDGFDEAWNPRVFNDADIDLRLFKIHGSVTWYRSDRGRYLKIPVMTSNSSVELITKERAESLMLYPAQKFEYVEPLFELLIEMKRRLAACKTLFVIGYSFRDDHIRRIFWDIARKNKDFYIVLISPNAREIYEERLKTYEGGIPSSLNGKVICLPYLFEKILPALKNEFLSDIRLSRSSLERRMHAETIGQNIDWLEGLTQTARGGDNEVLIEIFKKISQIDRKDLLQMNSRLDEDIFKCTALGLMHTIGNSDKEMISCFWKKFKDSILSIIDGLNVIVQPAQSKIEAKLISGLPLYQVGGFLQTTRDLVVTRKLWMKGSTTLDTLSNILNDLCGTLKHWSNGLISFSDYPTARNPCPQELIDVLEGVNVKANCTWDGQDRTSFITQKVREIEKSKIQEILDKYEKEFFLSA